MATTMVRCRMCRHYRPSADSPGWGDCDKRALPSLEGFGLRDPVWHGQYERECKAYESKEPSK